MVGRADGRIPHGLCIHLLGYRCATSQSFEVGTLIGPSLTRRSSGPLRGR